MYAYLDIETVPFEIVHDDVKTYLMDKKIGKEIRSFDPNYCKIVVIAVKQTGKETRIFSDGDERKIISDFWLYLKNNFNAGDVLITHNGYRYDIPFLIVRSCIKKVKIPLTVNTNPWNMEKSNHFDVMRFFSQNEIFTNQNLDILAKMHGIEVLGERFGGAEVERLYKEGKLDKIIKHCKQDVEILETVFEKLCKDYLENIKRL